MRARELVRRVVLGGFGVALFLGAWWGVSSVLNPLQLPPPTDVAKVLFPLLFHSDSLASQFGNGKGGILSHLFISLLRLLIGTTAGMTAGIGVGLLMSYDRRIGWLLDLPTRILRAVPPLAMIPFVLVWFGTQSISQVVLVALYIFLLVLTNTTNAVTNMPTVQVRFARTLGASKARAYRDVVLRAIMPELVGGLRVALAFAWGLLVVAELVGGQYGIGRVLSLLVPLLQTPELIATIVWIVVVAVALDALFVRLQRSFLRWHHG